MWFEDLARCDYFTEGPLIAVGWLERGKPFSCGVVERRVFEALREMQRDPWQPFVSAGQHPCDLCAFEPEAQGSANLFIPAGATLYVCPELIVHYINAHGYAPPDPFCRAVLACPPMRSMPYLKAIRAAGGTGLLRPAARPGGSETDLNPA